MKKKSVIVTVLAVILLIVIASCAVNSASADDEPATDTGYWGLSVPHAERFMLYKCTSKTLNQKPCYWNAREHGNYNAVSAERSSFWIIRVGDMKCKKFWDNRYDRRHGFCRKM